MKHFITITFILLFCFGGVSAGPIQKTVHIEFTHSADNGSNAGEYASLIEFKWTADTTMAWNMWHMITDTVTPLVFGTVDTLDAEILFPDDGEYYIAIRYADEVPNWSDVCNKMRLVLYDQVGPSCAPARIIGVD